MKLLVLAQTPPPLHGQSLMVGALVAGLPARGIAVCHVNLRLSHDAADIGRPRPGKILATLAAAIRAVVAGLRHDCDTLYYVPAPGKRGALYRDFAVMALCRPFFPRLVLHWHAAGLAEWLEAHGTATERLLAGVLLGRADLSLVLADTLRADAEALGAREIAVVPNGIADPGPVPPPPATGVRRVFFLGLCSETKGLFSAAQAVLIANARAGRTAFALTAAGPFEDEATAERFRALVKAHPAVLEHVGAASGEQKKTLFAACHVFCLPTRYAAEGLPLVLLEALAHDRPIVATQWRGLPEVVTAEVGRLVAETDEDTLATALAEVAAAPPPPGACRARYLARFTQERHLATLAGALHALDS